MTSRASRRYRPLKEICPALPRTLASSWPTLSPISALVALTRTWPNAGVPSSGGGAQQIRGAEDDARRAPAGDDALVVGKLALDQPAGDLDGAQGKMHVVVARCAAQSDGQARRGREGMGDLDQCACRDNPRGARSPVGQRYGPHR